jgi:predicted nucleic acid-binding protein
MDTGVIVSYYSADDKHHAQARRFFERCTSQIITTVACVTEAMYLLASDWRVQMSSYCKSAEVYLTANT